MLMTWQENLIAAASNIAGIPEIWFDGINDYLNSTNTITLPSAQHFSMVADIFLDTGNNTYIFRQRTVYDGVMLWGNPALTALSAHFRDSLDNFVNVTFLQSNWAIRQWFRIVYRWDAGTWKVRIGTNEKTGTLPNPNMKSSGFTPILMLGATPQKGISQFRGYSYTLSDAQLTSLPDPDFFWIKNGIDALGSLTLTINGSPIRAYLRGDKVYLNGVLLNP